MPVFGPPPESSRTGGAPPARPTRRIDLTPTDDRPRRSKERVAELELFRAVAECASSSVSSPTPPPRSLPSRPTCSGLVCFEVDATLSQSPLDPFHRVDLVCGDDARALKLRAMLETCAARAVDVCIITRNSRYLVDRFFGERGLDIMHLVSELRGFEDFDASNASKCDVAKELLASRGLAYSQMLFVDASASADIEEVWHELHGACVMRAPPGGLGDRNMKQVLWWSAHPGKFTHRRLVVEGKSPFEREMTRSRAAYGPIGRDDRCWAGGSERRGWA